MKEITKDQARQAEILFNNYRLYIRRAYHSLNPAYQKECLEAADKCLKEYWTLVDPDVPVTDYVLEELSSMPSFAEEGERVRYARIRWSMYAASAVFTLWLIWHII